MEVSYLNLESDMLKDVDKMYFQGMEAYLRGDDEGCINDLEYGLYMYQVYNNNMYGCPLFCLRSRSYNETDLKNVAHQLEEEEKCINSCHDKTREKLSAGVAEEFAKFKPYKYLQMCYYNVTMT